MNALVWALIWLRRIIVSPLIGAIWLVCFPVSLVVCATSREAMEEMWLAWRVVTLTIWLGDIDAAEEAAQ